MSATTLRQMDGARLARFRWRRRGAWLWPAFAAATIVDALAGHLLPPSGETQALAGAALSGLVLNLIAVVVLSGPLGALLARFRAELPRVVARDYAGAWAVSALTLVLLVAGTVHHSSVLAHRRLMRDATARAQAWIGDRAPPAFRRDLQRVSTFTLQPGMYRACVDSDDGRQTYCVIVNTALPFARSVRFAGHEPNSVFGAGVG